MVNQDVSRYIIQDDRTVLQAIEAIDKSERGIVFACKGKKLLFSISDGDIRRYILKNGDLGASIVSLGLSSPYFLFEEERECAGQLADEHFINAIPIVNHDNEIVDVYFRREPLDKKNKVNVPVVIMAGGEGTRLYPYTKILPKPLIPVGETPIIERIMNGFAEYGVNEFYVTVNYKKGMIRTYFNDLAPDYHICFVEEKKPLGTGGSIKLIQKKLEEAFFVSNCDSLIIADYHDIYNYHVKEKNAITMVTALKNITVPYGVVYTGKDGELIRMEEKPKLSFFINTGMYVINPDIIDYIPDDEMFHMTQLVEKVMINGGRVGTYPVSEDSFLDMGEFEELKRMEQKLNIISEK